MFTGIVTGLGSVVSLEREERHGRMTFSSPDNLLGDARVGDSMCVSGVCLTMLEIRNGAFSADVSGETLDCTTLGELGPGDPVNLEPALKATDRMGGHIVSGHVDGRARLVGRDHDGDSERFTFELPEKLARYVAAKGSICVDGVSLTVNRVQGRRFEVCIIPHTLVATTLGEMRPGQAANIEVDIIARYLERLMGSRQELAK